MKVWMTKYALTPAVGIVEIEVKPCSDIHPAMVEVVGGMCQYLHGEGREWHRHEYDALEKGILMADKKMESMKKQIKTIEMNQARWRNRRDQIRSQA